MNNISCLIDFSETGKTATSYAVWLAKKHHATINLMHYVANTEDQHIIENKLISYSEIESSNLPFTCTIITGKYLKSIAKALAQNKSDLLVIGSHGVQSPSQIWAAANVVHITQQIDIPAFVVNENTATAGSPIQNILFPIAPHANFKVLMEEAARWAKQNEAHIAILCLASKDSDLPADIARNLEDSERYFAKENIAHTKTLQESKVYSVGYAKDIIAFAEENQFDLISIMAQNSEENMYFGDVEKTNLIQNHLGIPILCSNSSKG